MGALSAPIPILLKVAPAQDARYFLQLVHDGDILRTL
jgi:hypothetical protein